MVTKDTYGAIVVWSSLAFLLYLLICSFVVSFQLADLLYSIALVVFAIKYFRMKWFYDDRYSLSYIQGILWRYW